MKPNLAVERRRVMGEKGMMLNRYDSGRSNQKRCNPIVKETTMKRHHIALMLTVFLILAGVGAAMAANPNPRVIPNHGPKYGELGAEWWQWALSFPAADVPYLNTGGPVDISAGQSGHVWFLAGGNVAMGSPRTGVVPTGTSLFFPLANLINDYPCPDSSFQPNPGETLGHFLQRTGNEFLPNLTDLFAEIDGVPLSNLSVYRATSPLFQFTADPDLSNADPCITGSLQDGVAVGYWLLLPPLTPGIHILHFGAPSWGQDVTYELTVTPSHR
jgi:hypothetical protein